MPIGLDHFATADDELASRRSAHGRLHRNFQGYTTDAADALIGIGASSIGRLPQGFVQNAPDMGGYSRGRRGRPACPIVKGIAFSADDRLRARIIERLMCDFASISTPSLQLRPPTTRSRRRLGRELDALAYLVAGMASITGRRIAVTAAGRPFVRLVAAAFDAYLPQNKSRHSVAV